MVVIGASANSMFMGMSRHPLDMKGKMGVVFWEDPGGVGSELTLASSLGADVEAFALTVELFGGATVSVDGGSGRWVQI